MTRPSAVPSTVPSSMASGQTMRMSREPTITREKTSRPSLSVPNQYVCPGGTGSGGTLTMPSGRSRGRLMLVEDVRLERVVRHDLRADERADDPEHDDDGADDERLRAQQRVHRLAPRLPGRGPIDGDVDGGGRLRAHSPAP